ncbi:MAG: class II fructose-bisphosphate aldolase [Mycobacterium sp.]
MASPIDDLPLSLPAMSTLAALTSRKSFLWLLIVVTSLDQMLNPLGISYFQGAHRVDWPLLMTANVMSLLPMLLVFIGARRYFVQSVASTGLDVQLIAQLHEAVPVPLMLHDSSGVADDQLRRAVAAGMTKINIGTMRLSPMPR